VKTGMGADTAEQLLTSGTQLGTCCTYVSMLHLLVYYVAPTCVLPVAHVAPMCLCCTYLCIAGGTCCTLVSTAGFFGTGFVPHKCANPLCFVNVVAVLGVVLQM